jgi:hypothetical protein
MQIELPEINISSIDSGFPGQAASISNVPNEKKVINVTKDQVLKSLNLVNSNALNFITPRRLAIVGILGLAAFITYKALKK